MCLLIVLSRAHADLPLVVAANRDERLDRPATPMTRLRERSPRVLGGRDEQAGGTWFAVNEHGVFAGLTNRPPGDDGPAPARRSRGELPLALAGPPGRTAAAAVAAFAAAYRPADFNPAWILVGDADHLAAIDMTGTGEPTVEVLPPGLHVLENHPLGAPSAKVAHVRRLLDGVESLPAADVVPRLERVVADHHVPGTGPRAALSAACVHAGGYGTRWSGTVAVARAGGGGPATPPRFRFADGPPCRAPFADADLW